MNDVFVELVVGEVVVALLELELILGHELQVRTGAAAHTAVASDRLGFGIDLDGIADGAAVAAALLGRDRHAVRVLQVVDCGRTHA